MLTSFFAKIDGKYHWIHGGTFVYTDNQISIYSPFMSASSMPLTQDIQKREKEHVLDSQR